MEYPDASSEIDGVPFRSDPSTMVAVADCDHEQIEGESERFAKNHDHFGENLCLLIIASISSYLIFIYAYLQIRATKH